MKQEYTGRCHCGKIKFSFLSEPITEGRRCNCSICVRKGVVMSPKYIPHADFKPHQNLDDLTDYRWNDFVCPHVFCKACGVHPYIGAPGVGDYGFRVNLGCVDQLDVFNMEIKMIDGKSMPVAENPGPHPGSL